jgi:hypothetical protein
MTSGTLRTILIVGAAVAAVSVAACKKPADNTATADANAAASDANAAMSSANSASNSAMSAGNAANDAAASVPANATNAP